MTKFKNSKGTGSGGTSILMVFVILCMVIFGALSLISSSSDFRLIQKSRQAAQDYYAADASAQKKLAEIDETLYTLKQSGANAYQTGINSALGTVEDITVVATGGETYIRYEYEMPDDKSLVVQARVLPFSSEGRYEIVSYKVVNTGEWNPGGDIDLFQ